MKRTRSLLLTVLILSSVALTTAHAQFVEIQDLLPGAITQGDRAGTSTAIWGEWAIVGAPTEPLNDPEWDNPGAAYFYQRQNDGTWTEMQQVLPNNDNVQARFATSVAIWDEFAVVGAPRHDTEVSDNTGVVYVYERQGGVWNEIQVLTASDATFCSRFGFSVSIWNGLLVVGANFHPNLTEIGAAYVFERQDNGTWTEEAILTADDGAPGDEFGYTVGVSGDYAIIGAPFTAITALEAGGGLGLVGNGGNGGGQSAGALPVAGAAYVFWRNPDNGNWWQIQKLIASDAIANQHFGLDVSISGSSLVVGAYGDDDYTGAAYVFEQSEALGDWIETQKLTASDGMEGDLFGHEVSMSGSRLLVGASRDGDDPEYTHAGSAYVFERQGNGTWTETQNLTASESDDDPFGTTHGDQFGKVAISGTRAVIGAPLFGTYAYGNAYVFEDAAAQLCPGILGSGELTFDQRGYDDPVYNLNLDAGRGATLEHIIFTSRFQTQTADPNGSPDGHFATYLKNGDLVASTSPRQWEPNERGSQTATFQFPVPTRALSEPSKGIHVEVASSCGAMASINLSFDLDPNDPTHGSAAPTIEVVETQAGVPQRFDLEGNYPNPFNPQTTIRYALPAQAVVSLTVFDVTGRVVRSLVSGATQTAGWHEATFEATDLPSGTYLYRLQAGEFNQTGRMVLLK